MLKVITAICSSIASGMALFLLVGTYFWLRYYVLQRQNPEHWKCQPERWPNRLVMRRDLFWGRSTCCGPRRYRGYLRTAWSPPGEPPSISRRPSAASPGCLPVPSSILYD